MTKRDDEIVRSACIAADLYETSVRNEGDETLPAFHTRENAFANVIRQRDYAIEEVEGLRKTLAAVPVEFEPEDSYERDAAYAQGWRD